MLSMFRKPQGTGVSPIAPAEAIARATNGEITLVDVREAAEIAATGKAQGALHIPLAMVSMKCDPRSPECDKALSVGKPVVVYCAAGGRSQMAAQQLVGMGYAQVFNMGGFGGWQAAGGKISR